MKAYPIIIYPSDGGVNRIDFPDMHNVGQSAGVADSFDMTHDGICLWAVTELNLGNALPERPDLAQLGIPDDAISALTEADGSMVESRDISPAEVRCTIPAWLAEEVSRRGVNCSVVLQQALLQMLEPETREQSPRDE